MKRDYSCPHCNSFLNVDDNIVFAFKRETGSRGVILLNSELGNYNANFHSDYIFSVGETVQFFCPVCSKDLKSKKHENLVVVNMKENGENYHIVFSRIFGEKCTYKIHDKSVDVYGKDAKLYQSVLDVSAWK